MIEVYPNVWVGSDADVDEFKDDHPKGAIIHAAKERWHRDAVGYTGRGAPKDHPEYLIAERIQDKSVAYNLIDGNRPEFVPTEIFAHAADYFKDALDTSTPLLVHCNQGGSRCVAISMYCLAKHTSFFVEDGLNVSFDSACDMFEEVYPDAEMADGVRGKLEELWEDL